MVELTWLKLMIVEFMVCRLAREIMPPALTFVTLRREPVGKVMRKESLLLIMSVRFMLKRSGTALLMTIVLVGVIVIDIVFGCRPVTVVIHVSME